MYDNTIEFEKLGDFNEVIEWYKRHLSIVKGIRPLGKFENHIDEYNGQTIPSIRARINNIGVNIAQNFDYIEKHCPDNIDELILRELDSHKEARTIGKDKYKVRRVVQGASLFRESFKKAMQDNNLTPFETLKQIRNAFLHGNYIIRMKAKPELGISRIEIEKEDGSITHVEKMCADKEIQLHSAKMDATFQYWEVMAFMDTLFYNVSSKYSTGTKEFTFSDRNYASCKNEAYLRKFIDSLQSYYIIPTETDGKGNVYEIISLFPALKETIQNMQRSNKTKLFIIKSIPEEKMRQRKEDVEKYIRYVGKDKWQHTLNSGLTMDLFDNVFQSRFNEKITTISFTNEYAAIMDRWYDLALSSKKMGKLGYLQTAKISCQIPFVYSDMLLGVLNYACGYLKANNAENDNIFEYHNLKNFDGIVPSIDNDRVPSIQKDVSGEEKAKKLQLAIDGYKLQLANIEKGLKKVCDILVDLDEDDPKQNKKKIKFKGYLEEGFLKEEKVRDKISKLTVRKEEYSENYTDYSELFRHLRNSIAHGRYEIEYNAAFASNDFDKIKFTFVDYNEDNIKEEIPDFKIELTPSKIMRIVSSVQTRVNEQLTKEQQMSRITRTRIIDLLGLTDEDYEKLKKEVVSKTESENAEVGLKEKLNQKDIDER